ncbi:MAG TPA: UvrD-helicase domain-containing protein, partial [Candidatus Acidoferrales bacterium]|nr:UvrD-helicase domain-containing protein [Candidatus Acidoferrales bacterium]
MQGVLRDTVRARDFLPLTLYAIALSAAGQPVSREFRAIVVGGGDAAALDEAGQRKLRQALFSFDRAPIHTIHSFCSRTLSELAFQSGMRLRVELTDGLSAFNQAYRAELRDHLARDKSARVLLDEWMATPHKSDDLEKLLRAAYVKRYLASGERTRRPSSAAAARKLLPLEVRIVDAFLPMVAARMERMKRERGLLDYDDMLEWLARALDEAHGPALASALRDRYRYALIDEFQDTDEMQWRIFRRVFVEGGGANYLYVIGDPKQAIYSFRGADVFTYLEARRDLSRRNATLLPLVENFRSTKSLIEAVNLIFKQDADPPLFTGDIRYDHPVVCGRESLRAVDRNNNPVAPITVMALSSAEKMKAARARDVLGRHIANTVRALLEDGPHALRISTLDGTPEPVKAGEIFILTRSNRESIAIGEHLRTARVPFAFYKQEGLFATPEAANILDALRGVLEPGARSRRLKAWTTPFFAVPYAELHRVADPPPSHPLLERLYQWKALADAERFADLFDAMLHRSGLVNRELFLSDSERELTNYLHIFEILLEKALGKRLALAEVIDLLASYIAGWALPGGDDSDVQRLESERDAVQVMTIHKSKGLEADVVFVYGGFNQSPLQDDVSVFHESGARRLAVGKEERDRAKDRIRKELEEEDQRLLYVAATRARAKLYLPYFPEKSIRQLNGLYLHMNSRLRAILAPPRSRSHRPDLFEIEEVAPSGPTDSASDSSRAELAIWNPSDELLDDTADAAAQRELAAAGARHAPFKIWSYTSIRGAAEFASRFNFDSDGSTYESDEFKIDVDAVEARAESDDLPGGRAVGVFVHEAIERLDFASLGPAPNFDSWMVREDVRDLFADAMRRHGVTDQRWLDRGREVVFSALTAPIALGDEIVQDGLFRLPNVREMEFAYPIPEKNHLLAAGVPHDGWTVERGYVKGSIDIVFRHGGRFYFADWKTDLLPSYDPAAIAAHVERNYSLQMQIYAIGTVRLLGIRSEPEYEARFGGLLYVFLRGVSAAGDSRSGIFFARPAWSEIVNYESALVTADTDFRIHA